MSRHLAKNSRKQRSLAVIAAATMVLTGVIAITSTPTAEAYCHRQPLNGVVNDQTGSDYTIITIQDTGGDCTGAGKSRQYRLYNGQKSTVHVRDTDVYWTDELWMHGWTARSPYTKIKLGARAVRCSPPKVLGGVYYYTHCI